jgi:predicted nucleotidyltransferase
MTDLAERIVPLVVAHPAVREIKFAGSRAEGRATEWSDWDFLVEAHDFAAVSDALPRLLAPLEPLVEQWDRLSTTQCWMLILDGPSKIDLIFPDEPHEQAPPWEPTAENLRGIDDHFWDWMLWLKGKETAGKRDVVASELEKLSAHLLRPLGVTERPGSIRDSIALYRDARADAERRFDCSVARDVEAAVAPALERRGH